MVNTTYQKLKKHIDEVRIIDTHEHLPQEKDRVSRVVDALSELFIHYTSSDLVSAGMRETDVTTIRDTSKPLDERWSILEPWWERIRNTGYARAIEIAARDLYDVPSICSNTYRDLSNKMRDKNREGLYRWVLKEKAGIDISILDDLTGSYEIDRNFFAPVLRVDDLMTPSDRNELEIIAKLHGVRIHDFNDYVALVRKSFDEYEGKIFGIKIALAYQRPLFFEKRSYSDGEEAFNKLYKTRGFTRYTPNPTRKESRMVPWGPGIEELLPMQDYLVHIAIQEAEKRRLPIQIHTGLQEGNENILSNSNPELLVNLFMEYRDAKFDIFHGAWPYCNQLSALAKNFPNVYLDMSWMHIISPSRSRSALYEWLDEVPVNKILGFGGDFLCVEGTYGHTVIARENIAKVLALKVEDGDFKLEDAKKYATWILRKNAEELFFPEGC
ncbi:MAG: amidohydrolase family protein [Candidatus Bathyarchaeia archaeon]|jgi:hypothetical protein